MRRLLLILLFTSQYVIADGIQLNTFQNGEVADADKVNENFNSLKNAIESTSFNLIGREEQSVLTYDNDYQYGNDEYGGMWVLTAIASCNQDEIGISGGCKVVNPNKDIGEFLNMGLTEENYTKDNQHFCRVITPIYQASSWTMTAYINCVQQ